MILNNDKTIIKETVEVAPITNKMLFDLGFTYYQSSYDHTTGWKYRDKDGADTLLVEKESRLEGYPRRFEEEIYFPQYTDTPRLRIPDPHQRSVKAVVYNEGQLKLFVELVEQAAELRMDIKRRSDNLKEIIQDKLWKG